MKYCEHCGKPFESRKYWQKFCSVSCRMAYHYETKIKPKRSQDGTTDNRRDRD